MQFCNLAAPKNFAATFKWPRLATAVLAAVVSLSCLGPASAQDLFAYPGQGQTRQQQDQDEFACYRWAKDRSGFDPMAAPHATSAPPKQKSTGPGVVGGAVRGAVVGGLVGGIAGGSKKAKKGMKIGAVSGGLFGGVKNQRRSRKNRQAQQNWESQQAAQYAYNRDTYNRAWAACMQGRGYSVS